MQRVDHRIRHFHLDEHTDIKQPGKAVARRNRHMMIARGTDVQIRREFAVKQHRPAFRAFRPKILGHLAAQNSELIFGRT